MKTVYAQLLNERGDYQEVEVELGLRHGSKPRFMGITVGWKDPSFEQLLAEAGEDAERFTNERRPGTWFVAGFLNPDDLSGTEADRAEELWRKLDELAAAG